MARHLTIARPYAKALFSTAQTADQLQKWNELLQSLGQLMADRNVLYLMANPKLSQAQLISLVCEVAEKLTPDLPDDMKEKLQHLITLLVSAKRLEVLPDIALLYQRLLAEYKGIVEAEVVSAFPLDESVHQDFYTMLEKQFNSKVTIEFNHDESLIGGALIRAGNWVLDGSIKDQLNRLSEQFE